jgi:hypothetical protein
MAPVKVGPSCEFHGAMAADRKEIFMVTAFHEEQKLMLSVASHDVFQGGLGVFQLNRWRIQFNYKLKACGERRPTETGATK